MAAIFRRHKGISFFCLLIMASDMITEDGDNLVSSGYTLSSGALQHD